MVSSLVVRGPGRFEAVGAVGAACAPGSRQVQATPGRAGDYSCSYFSAVCVVIKTGDVFTILNIVELGLSVQFDCSVGLDIIISGSILFLFSLISIVC